MFKSAKNLEITGTEVTATPTARMMMRETRVLLGPARAGPTSQDQSEADQERNTGSDNGQPTHGAPLFPREQLARLGSRQEHQEQKSQPVDETQDGCVMARNLDKGTGAEP